MLKRILLWGVLLLAPATAYGQGSSFGFAPQQTTQTISVTTSSSSITLPTTPGDTVFVANTGSNTAYIRNSATATTGTGFPLPAGANVFLNYPHGTVVSAITASSTTTLLIVKGSGASAIGGGGSSGGGGGGAVTITAPLGTNAIADSVAVTPATSSVWPATQSGTWSVNPTTPASWGIGATGAAVPANAQFVGMSDGTNMIPLKGSATNGLAIDCGASNNTLCALMQTAMPVNVGSTPTAVQGRTVGGETGMSVDINSIAGILPDPCQTVAKTNKAFTTNGTSSVQLVAISGSTTVYVCSLSFIAAGATTVAFTTGTGSACATSNAAVIGSDTSGIANSLSFAANGGLTLGNGQATVASGAASSALCMINGTNVYVSGNLTYVQR